MKILLVGAACQGKTTYAVKYAQTNTHVIDNLHMWVKDLLSETFSPQATILDDIAQHSNWLIICDEIGCGIVPIDKAARRWREETGRLCCKLAEQADIVERITCGIPIRIKGEGIE